MNTRLSLRRRILAVSGLIAGAASFASAQIPVRMLPGLGENGTIWNQARSDFISRSLSVTADTLHVTTTNRITSQASSIGSQDTLSVLVGHSAGGLVARRRNQMQQTNGYITIGSPMQGAPIVPGHTYILDHLFYTVFDIGVAAADFINTFISDLDAWGDVHPYTDDVASIGAYIMSNYLTSNGQWGLGTSASADVTPGSTFLDSLTYYDVGAESGFRMSVSVVDGAGGSGAIWRVIPSTADDWDIWDEVLEVGSSLAFAAEDFYNGRGDAEAQNDPELSDEYYRLAADLDYVGWDLFYVDAFWCTAVGNGYCYTSDSFIPTAYQTSSGLDLNYSVTNGPAHIAEAQKPGLLADMLENYFGVSPHPHH